MLLKHSIIFSDWKDRRKGFSCVSHGGRGPLFSLNCKTVSSKRASDLRNAMHCIIHECEYVTRGQCLVDQNNPQGQIRGTKHINFVTKHITNAFWVMH